MSITKSIHIAKSLKSATQTKTCQIHILPQKKHRIRNEQTDELEFIVISKPTIRGDRNNEQFE